ncbi:invasion protein IalB [Bartonella silvatica]|uniref:Invasion protein IalB n=1 Tax=Bartonella silvatica TaxID=357760 RepID=A0ABV2HGI5_9HYPH
MKRIDIIIKKRNIFAYILFTLALMGKGESLANEKNNTYTVHPPQLSIPKGAPGETRRIITQFYYWTLICDEKEKLRQGVCNVTQAVHDQEDNTVFSWSLVSTKSGQAVMLLRTLPNADTKVPIRLFMEGVKEPLLIRYTQCDKFVCLAQFLVKPILNKQIEQNKEVRISYRVKKGKEFSFTLPFKGLSEALYSLQR